MEMPEHAALRRDAFQAREDAERMMRECARMLADNEARRTRNRALLAKFRDAQERIRKRASDSAP